MSIGEAIDEAPVEESPAFGKADEEVGRGNSWRRAMVFGVLPGLALLLALTAGFVKWQGSSVQYSEVSAAESLQAAKDSTVALLSYRPDTVERDLTAARDRTTGAFRESYTQLINDVVIPGSKEQQIAAAVTIPAAASVSADANRAVALLFVNQTIGIGADTPTESVSSIRVTLEKAGERWLVSGFDPV